MNKPDDLILLGSMPIPDAHIVKGVLDEYGIRFGNSWRNAVDSVRHARDVFGNDPYIRFPLRY